VQKQEEEEEEEWQEDKALSQAVCSCRHNSMPGMGICTQKLPPGALRLD
jgi:hypothetical protein